MRRSSNLAILLLLYVSTSNVYADSLSRQDAMNFFDTFVALGNSFDTTITKLYSDSAEIRLNRVYPNGSERSMQLTGAQWKILIISAMPLAKAQNDRSEYNEVAVISEGENLKIAAKRYSLRKCYLDRDYYMVISRQSDGEIKIVEEYLNTQPQSNC